MSILALLLLGLSISMDNFAVSLSLGMSQLNRSVKAVLSVPLMFGVCQFLMPLLGWLAGSRVAFLFQGHERWPLFLSLVFVGWRMVRSAKESEKSLPGRAQSLAFVLSLSLATSLDSLAVGFGLAMLRVGILEASLVFGLTGAILSLLGLVLGKRLGLSLGKHSRLVGGLTLVALGVRALVAR